jgi:small subunit ribosomal protein S17
MATLVGKVVSNKIPQTAVVLVESFVIHPKYQKRMMRTKRFLVHDELGTQEGDMVKFVEIKPMSKLKRWKAVEVVK